MTLSAAQQRLLETWLPGARVRDDLSWGLVGNTVLLVEHRGVAYTLKAGDAEDSHLAREIQAYRNWTSVLSETGDAPTLREYDIGARVLLLQHLPGALVQGDAAESSPRTYRQAGKLLRRFHDQASETDQHFEARERDKALAFLDGPHRIPSEQADRLRRIISGWPTPASTVVPTHGDWQPRNWIQNAGRVRAIDFERAAMRPAWTDLNRLAVQQFRGHPHLREAFVDGYGCDPAADDPEAWDRDALRAGVGTACWAHTIGDEDYEAQGLRMITEALDTW